MHVSPVRFGMKFQVFGEYFHRQSWRIQILSERSNRSGDAFRNPIAAQDYSQTAPAAAYWLLARLLCFSDLISYPAYLLFFRLS
jgi:hypothetical protein